MRHRTLFLALVCASLLLTPTLSAATLLTNGSTLTFTGDAQVGATFLNWLCSQIGDVACPANTGDFSVNVSTGTFAPYNGTFGLIKNISEASQPIQNVDFATLSNFITFRLNNSIQVDLNQIPMGTDTPSSTCAGTNHCTPTSSAFVNANNPGGLSAFNLDYNTTTNTTIASFSFFGTVRDTVNGVSGSYIGGFSDTIQGLNPQQVLEQLARGGTINQGYSEQGQLTIRLIPEPMTMSLMGAGLLGLGLIRRRLTK